MAIRGDKARSPSSPRFQLGEHYSSERRVRPVADRTGEKASPNKKGEKVLCPRTNDEQIYRNDDPLYSAAVKPGTRSTRRFEACCKLAERAAGTIRR